MESVDNNQRKQIFVEGHGGTGKTYLWKAITTKIGSQGKIILAVASCGIAALLLEGG
jgi:tRNA A37 threonylcarbamoyladenosine biosynthesis protein TsaE